MNIGDRGHFDPEWKDKVNAEDKARREAQIKEAQAKIDIVTNAFESVANTPNGAIVFKHLCQWLDFKGSSLAANATTGVDTTAMVYNEARRKVWIDIRKMLSTATRNMIEEDSPNAG